MCDSPLATFPRRQSSRPPCPFLHNAPSSGSIRSFFPHLLFFASSSLCQCRFRRRPLYAPRKKGHILNDCSPLPNNTCHLQTFPLHTHIPDPILPRRLIQHSPLPITFYSLYISPQHCTIHTAPPYPFYHPRSRHFMAVPPPTVSRRPRTSCPT